jgi:hypothetical protein
MQTSYQRTETIVRIIINEESQRNERYSLTTLKYSKTIKIFKIENVNLYESFESEN